MNGRIEFAIVDADMKIGRDCKLFIGESDKAFNVKLILGDIGDALRVKNDNFSSSWLSKVIRKSVHQQVIAGFSSDFENILPGTVLVV